VFPLAIPLLAGPGVITTVLLYSGGRSATELLVFVAMLLTVLAVQFVLDGIVRASDRKLNGARLYSVPWCTVR
jgi:small neutral amino acid transporter SnatA (MarC family)